MISGKQLLFTISDVENLATQASFNKGVDYYESGVVGKIERSGDYFKGVVFGSRKYQVTLNLSDKELKFFCNCPYDFGGICKHEVAFALKILNNDYTDYPDSKEAAISGEQFEKIFKEVKKEKKLKFLKQLLERDTELQHQFIEFTKEISENLDNIGGEQIEKIKNDIHND